MGTKTPAPPSGGNSTGGKAAGGSGGATAAGSTADGSGGSTVGGGSGMACTTTPDCMGTGFICKAGMCACTTDVPDVCGAGATAACVNKKADPEHCGDCLSKCDAGATCVDSKCTKKPVELSKGTGCGPMRLAIQGTDVYWTEPMTKKVRSMPLAGGAAVEVATGDTLSYIAADATGVYWNDDAAFASKVMKKALPLAAGAPVALVTHPLTASDTNKILGIAVHGRKLYYSLAHDVHQISTTGTGDMIVGTAVNYDAPAKIDGIPHGIAVNETMIAWTDVGDRNGVEGDDIMVESNMPLTDKSGYCE